MDSEKFKRLDKIKNKVPWWIHVSGKLILSRLPLNYHTWKKLHIFDHGNIEPDHMYRAFLAHLQQAGLVNLKEKTILELGPGDSLCNAIMAKSFGAEKIYLVDVADFATREIPHYQRMTAYLRAQKVDCPDISDCNTVNAILKKCDATYLTNGYDAYRHIPNGAIDFLFSNDVLEHVRKHELVKTIRELRRITAPDGIHAHLVDFKDHIGGELNNLRFSDKIWESDFFAESGFYTNRLRLNQLLNYFTDGGFVVQSLSNVSFKNLNIKRKKMDHQFRELSDLELRVAASHIILRPA